MRYWRIRGGETKFTKEVKTSRASGGEKKKANNTNTHKQTHKHNTQLLRVDAGNAAFSTIGKSGKYRINFDRNTITNYNYS